MRILLCVIAATVAVSAAAAQSPSVIATVTVTSISDGDTVWVDRAGERLHVRLFGVDAPEGPQTFGMEATEFTSRMLLGQRAAMTRTGADQSGRTVARLAIDGRDVAEALVSAGLAWHDTRYAPRDARLAAGQRQARQARRGLWADPAPQPPWEFRRTPPPAQSSTPVAYRGNRNSHVFHAPGCRDYDCKNCTIALSSIDVARARGFRPHAACVR